MVSNSIEKNLSIPRSRLDDLTVELCFEVKSRPLSRLSIAETFSLLELSTLSKLRSDPLSRDFDWDRSIPEETEAREARVAVLSIATIAEVPYPGKFKEADECVLGTFLSRTEGEACLLWKPPSSSLIIWNRRQTSLKRPRGERVHLYKSSTSTSKQWLQSNESQFRRRSYPLYNRIKWLK